MKSTSLLIIFLKVPVPGRVKTRLAAAIGPERACKVYRHLVNRLLVSLDSLEEVELRVSPDDGLDACKDWAKSGWCLKPQGEGDLGQRMSRAFEEAFSEGRDRVVVIGSDCPHVTPGHIKAAYASLKQANLVVGPATDGGYWLIGLNAFESRLFQGIQWSTDTVLSETLGLAKEAGLSLDLLEILEDIDDIESLSRFESEERQKAQK